MLVLLFTQATLLGITVVYFHKELKKMALGLQRLEKLVEELKREIAFGGSQLEGYRRTVEAKTSDYTIGAADSGKILTTEGAAGAVVFTLPTPTESLKGMWVDIVQAADQNMRVTCETADKIISQGSLVIDYIENTEAGLKVGAHCECVCTGTKWIVRVAGVSASYWTFAGV